MLLLGLSVLALWIAPMLSSLHRHWPWRLLTSERYIYLFILVLLALGFLPSHFKADGWLAFVKLGAATGLFWLIEIALRRASSHSVHPMTLFAIVLSVHCLLDGLVLSLGPSLADHAHLSPGFKTPSPKDHHFTILSVSIVLHRLPIGLGIWTFIRRQRSAQLALFILALASVMTLIGYSFGYRRFVAIGDYQHLLPELEYLIAGGLIHMGGHSLYPSDDADAPSSPDESSRH